MNLVTAQRSTQVATAGLEKEVSKLVDHVDDVDDHLRGVAGRESMDTRVTVMEKGVHQHGVLITEFAKHFGALEADVREIRNEVSTLKIHHSITDKTEAGRTARFTEWLRFWGPIIIASLALIAPKITLNNWRRLTFFFRSDAYRPDERLRKEIEADKKGERGKAVRKKLAEIERAAAER